MIILRQQAINITGLKTANIGNIQMYQMRWYIVMDWIDQLKEVPGIAIGIGQDRSRSNEILQGILAFVRIHGTKLKHSCDDQNGYGMVLSGECNGMGAGMRNQPPVGEDGVGGQKDFVDPGHDGEGGSVVYDDGFDVG